MPAKKRRPAKSSAAAKATKSARPPDLGLPTTVASQWARVARVHGMINRGERVTAEALAVELEVEARTMYRTFDFMRDELGLPLDYSYEVKSFVYMRPCPFLPLVRITPD
jgi:predicted DNA-binding transcriptional regulator YafY